MSDDAGTTSNVVHPLVTQVVYLSGAPRLSTKASTESLGPRSHILGVIEAFRESGSSVWAYVVGDEVPDSYHGAGSEARMTASRLRLLAADLGRFAYRLRSRLRLARRMRRESRRPTLAYERYALMQQLGDIPRRRGATWVLEVNALLAIESTSDRRATSSRRIATFFEKRTLRKADLIVAVTEQLRSAIHRIYGIPAERILVIENGVDTTKHANASPRPQERPTIGFLGTLYSWQNVDQLLRAMTRSETPWSVRIAGEGPELEPLKKLARELQVDDRADFLGRVHPDEVPAFLATVDVCYAGHSSSEGVYFSPLKLWEYLAAGRPVVASAHEATTRLQAAGYPVLTFGDSSPSLDDVLAEASKNLPGMLASAVARQDQVRDEHSWRTRLEPLLQRVARIHGGPS